MAITGEIKMTPPDVSGAARVRELVEGGEELKPEAPRPLMRELPPADPFPIDALGDVLAPAARAIQDRVRAPLAICGQSVLAAANLATQAHVNVVLPIGSGQPKPVSSYFMTVALSGERKSECDRQAGWPIRKRETEMRDTYDAELPGYINAKVAWDKARDAAIKRGKRDRAAIKTALDALGSPPVPLLEPLLTCPEPTYEGMVKHLAVGQPSIGIFATEGGQFIGGHGMRDEAKLFTAAGLSAAWDGDPIKRVRAGDGTIILAGRRVAMHLMAQPGVADILFRDPLLADQGLLSRLLVTAPPSAAGSRMWREERPETDRDLKRYGARLLDTLEAPLPLSPGKTNELEPRPLSLAPEARSRWISFTNYVERAIGQGGELEPVRGLGNKLPEHAARLAEQASRSAVWHAEDWRARFDERAGFLEHDGGWSRAQAEVQAFESCLVEWLNRNPSSSPAGRCAWCGKSETPSVIVLPFGAGEHHAWLHSDCWPAWRQSRRSEAVLALRGMGIAPSGSSERSP